MAVLRQFWWGLESCKGLQPRMVERGPPSLSSPRATKSDAGSVSNLPREGSLVQVQAEPASPELMCSALTET